MHATIGEKIAFFCAFGSVQFNGKRLHLTKFVLSCHPNPAAYLDREGKYLQRDHSIRHYLYPDIDGLSLDDLENTNVETIN